MKILLKNKDEGTELFKGGNFRPAAARYQKALSHAAKFFDLSPDDIEEVKGVKLTLYLNLASCYLKMENYDMALRNCNDALEIDPKSVKALFRRSAAYEAKKDLDNALADIKQCQQLSEVEDKLISKASERVKKEIAKQKDKEKKMWGKAFA
jgi:tetratricopeptide (TPR) repeat protein